MAPQCYGRGAPWQIIWYDMIWRSECWLLWRQYFNHQIFLQLSKKMPVIRGKRVPVDGCMDRRLQRRVVLEVRPARSVRPTDVMTFYITTRRFQSRLTILCCNVVYRPALFDVFLLPRFMDIRTKLLPRYNIQLQSWVRSSDGKRRQTFEAEAEDNNPSPQITYNITKYPLNIWILLWTCIWTTLYQICINNTR